MPAGGSLETWHYTHPAELPTLTAHVWTTSYPEWKNTDITKSNVHSGRESQA